MIVYTFQGPTPTRPEPPTQGGFADFANFDVSINGLGIVTKNYLDMLLLLLSYFMFIYTLC